MFTRGFLEKLKGIITEKEVLGLYDGFFIITCEIAMRFLHDYVDGDNYFKIDYPEHNLDRARCQLALALDMVANLEKMQDIVKKYTQNKQFGD